MSERTGWSGTAAGRKVKPKDEDQPIAAGPSNTDSQVHVVMAQAKLSEADAQWLIEAQYWASLMHTAREVVDGRNRAREIADEMLREDNDG